MRQETNVFADGSRTVQSFDEVDNLIRTVDFDSTGRIVWDIQYHLNTEGQVIGWIIYDSDGKPVKKFVRMYDDEGLQEDLQFDSDGKLEQRTVEMYNAKGSIVTKIYDGNGALIQEH